MTNIEKAIKMTNNALKILEEEYKGDETYSILEIILNALREKAERDNPNPLTEAQIRERVGKPVYIKDSEDADNDGWYIVAYAYNDGFTSVEEYYFDWVYLNNEITVFDHEPRMELHDDTEK